MEPEYRLSETLPGCPGRLVISLAQDFEHKRMKNKEMNQMAIRKRKTHRSGALKNSSGRYRGR